MKEERRKLKNFEKEDGKSSLFGKKKHLRNHLLSKTNCGVIFFVCSNKGVCRKEPVCKQSFPNIVASRFYLPRLEPEMFTFSVERNMTETKYKKKEAFFENLILPCGRNSNLLL
jgi:hypothetical protein